MRGLGDDQPDQPHPLRGAQQAGHRVAGEPGQRGLQIAQMAQIGQIGQAGLHDAAEPGGQLAVGIAHHRQQQLFLVAVMVVDGALGHARLGGDGVDAGALVTVPDEQRQRRGRDRRPLLG
jgi:hypothetical protein